MDQWYASSYVNLAYTYSLQNNQAAAIGKINELENICAEANNILPGNAYLVRGIALVKNGQTAQAQADFEQAVKKNAYQTAYNKALYQKIYTSWQNQVSDWLTHWPSVEKWIYQFWNNTSNSSELKPEKIAEVNGLMHIKETGVLYLYNQKVW